MGNWNLKFSHNKELCRVIALRRLLLCLRLEAAAGRAVTVGHHWGILVGGGQVPQQLSSIFIGIGRLHLHDNKRKSGRVWLSTPIRPAFQKPFYKSKNKSRFKGGLDWQERETEKPRPKMVRMYHKSVLHVYKLSSIRHQTWWEPWPVFPV